PAREQRRYGSPLQRHPRGGPFNYGRSTSCAWEVASIRRTVQGANADFSAVPKSADVDGCLRARLVKPRDRRDTQCAAVLSALRVLSVAPGHAASTFKTSEKRCQDCS